MKGDRENPYLVLIPMDGAYIAKKTGRAIWAITKDESGIVKYYPSGRTEKYCRHCMGISALAGIGSGKGE